MKKFIIIVVSIINICYFYSNFNIYLKNDIYKIRYFLQNRYSFAWSGYSLDRKTGYADLIGYMPETKYRYKLSAHIQDGWGNPGEGENYNVDFKKEPSLMVDIELDRKEYSSNGVPYKISKFNGNEFIITIFFEDYLEYNELKYVKFFLENKEDNKGYFISAYRFETKDDEIFDQISEDKKREELKNIIEKLMGNKLEDLIYKYNIYGEPEITYYISDFLKGNTYISPEWGIDYRTYFRIEKDDKGYFVSEKGRYRNYIKSDLDLDEYNYEYENTEAIQIELKLELEKSLNMKLEDIISTVNQVSEIILKKYRLAYLMGTVFKLEGYKIFILCQVIIYYLVRKKYINKACSEK